MDLIIGLIFNGGLVLTALFILFVNNKKVKVIVPTIFLSIYLVVLIVGVTSNIHIGDKITIAYEFTGKWAQKDIIWSPIPESMWGFLTNITMLVPLGLYIGAVCKKPLIKSVIFGFATGFCIELVQFIFPIPRYPQVSDIWLNGVSTILGCLYSMLFVWLKTKIPQKANKNDTQEVASVPQINIQAETTSTNKPILKEKEKLEECSSTNLEGIKKSSAAKSTTTNQLQRKSKAQGNSKNSQENINKEKPLKPVSKE